MDTTIISVHSRNLALAWSTTPTGHGTHIAAPTCPDRQGGPRSIRDELAHMRRIVSGGTFHRVALCVNRQRVTHWREVGDAAWRYATDWHERQELIARIRDGFKDDDGYHRIEVRTTH